MKTLHKKLVINEKGKPMEVIIPWKEFIEIVELLGLDFDDNVIEDLKQEKKDRESGNKESYLDLDSV